MMIITWKPHVMVIVFLVTNNENLKMNLTNKCWVGGSLEKIAILGIYDRDPKSPIVWSPRLDWGRVSRC